MRNRLPIAISSAALVIVVLGVSPLGGAAIQAGKHAAGLSGKTQRGPRGPRGPRGLRGPVGRTGARGPTGAKGTTGPKGTTGAKGTTGQMGATGSAGAPASQHWAVAAGDGTLIRGQGLIAINPVVRNGTGFYSVFFLNQPADACAWAASIASTSIANIPSSGYLTLQQGMSTNEVDVRTYVSGGTLADQPFMLSLFC